MNLQCLSAVSHNLPLHFVYACVLLCVCLQCPVLLGFSLTRHIPLVVYLLNCTYPVYADSKFSSWHHQGRFFAWQGVLNPLVERRAGDWYPAEYVTGSNMRGAYGYRVSRCIALICITLTYLTDYLGFYSITLTHLKLQDHHCTVVL